MGFSVFSWLAFLAGLAGWPARAFARFLPCLLPFFLFARRKAIKTFLPNRCLFQNITFFASELFDYFVLILDFFRLPFASSFSVVCCLPPPRWRWLSKASSSLGTFPQGLQQIRFRSGAARRLQETFQKRRYSAAVIPLLRVCVYVTRSLV